MNKNFNARDLAAEILDKIINEGTYANICLSQSLNENQVDTRERSFITNLVYGCLKKWVPIEYQLNQFLTKPLKKKDEFLEIILHLGVYEILFAATPDRAAVNEAVNLAKKHGHQGWGGLTNGVLRNIIRAKENLQWPNFKDEIDKEIFFQSLPLWLGDMWRKERGDEETLILIKSLDVIHPLSIRTNTLKTNQSELLQRLKDAEVEAVPGEFAPDCIKILGGKNPFLLNISKVGFFAVQEEASQLAVLALAPKPKEMILDMCAAPGGKSTYIAQLMENKGTICASDIHEHKIKMIDYAIESLGIDIIEALVKDGQKWGEECFETFDRILLDVPCSGLGVLGRRQDARFKKSESDIIALQKIQRELIDSAVKALKVGGRLIYSTCTLSQRENQENRQYILDNYKNMLPLDLSNDLPMLKTDSLKQGYTELLPHIHGTDGFFIAGFVKEKI
ncbi:MAG: 16S rRNA (cytosine(967)-C(5))-methyltransferase RsmB [Clostridiales bacterium]